MKILHVAAVGMTFVLASPLASSQAQIKINTEVFAINGELQPPPPFETVMGRNDLNKDGIIAKEEAVQAGTPLGQGFDMWDPNKDGTIDSSELHLIIDAINAAIADQGKANGDSQTE
jgi:hypothetical protein